MRLVQKTSTVIVLVGLLLAVGSTGSEALAREGGRRHKGPPPEAYTACEGKEEGEKSEFEGRRGHKVSGTCVQDGDRLVLHPDHHPRRGKSEPSDE